MIAIYAFNRDTRVTENAYAYRTNFGSVSLQHIVKYLILPFFGAESLKARGP